MLAWALTILILFLHPVPAVSQEPPSPTHQADVLRAVAEGKGKNALVYYESQAARFENLANSAESPHAYWQSAAQAYRLASITARYLGNFHKGIIYAERMLALAEKIGSLDLKLLAISSLYTAHRSTRNFAKAAAFTELGFKILDEVPANSIDRIWWSSSFLRYRADDFRQQQDYEKAAEAYLQSISLKEDYLKKFSGDGDRAANRIEVARSLQLNAYSSLAGTYLIIGKLDLAFETYERGLAMTQEWGLEYPRINFYLGLGNVLRRRVQLAGALDNYQMALELARRQQRPEMIASAARHIGDILRSSGKAAEALVFYGEAVQQIESVRSLLATQNNRESYFGDSLEA